MRAAARHVWSSPDLEGLTIAIQGVGKVGSSLAGLLAEDGANLLVGDIDQTSAESLARSLGAKALPPEEILFAPCDILAPCALGGVLDHTTIPDLRCSVVVGPANNQLAGSDCAALLARHGILYVPDYLANAGGIINISAELDPDGYDPERAREMVDGIESRVSQILTQATGAGIDPAAAAAALARRRLRAPKTIASKVTI